MTLVAKFKRGQIVRWNALVGPSDGWTVEGLEHNGKSLLPIYKLSKGDQTGSAVQTELEPSYPPAPTAWSIEYKQQPFHEPLSPCGFCGAAASMWQFMDKDTDQVSFVVMCSLTEQESPTGDDCPLCMPPNTFYAPRKKEAAKYWNEWAKFGNSNRRATQGE
jgi:hypothetical protein